MLVTVQWDYGELASIKLNTSKASGNWLVINKPEYKDFFKQFCDLLIPRITERWQASCAG